MIGSLGSIIFETSDRRILTFQDLSREVAGRWAAHAVVGKKPVKEFLGPEAQKVSFTIQLSAGHGVRPRAMLEAMASMVESGTVAYLIIGQRPVGRYPFALVSMSETWNTVYSGGELYSASVSITLEEYT